MPNADNRREDGTGGHNTKNDRVDDGDDDDSLHSINSCAWL